MKKMEAFACLRMKDALEGIVIPVSRDLGIVIGAVALMAINTAFFKALAISTLAVATVFIAAKIAVFLSRAAISALGFSEPGLERAALS